MIYWLKPSWAQLLQRDPQSLINEIPTAETSEENFGLALAYEFLGKNDLAEKYFKQALIKNIGHVPTIYVMGLKAFQKRKEPEAKTYLRRALRMDPRAAQTALAMMRDLKTYVGDPIRTTDISCWILQELETLGKETDSTCFQLGKLLFEKSKYEEAATYLKRSLKDPDVANEATEYLSYIFEHLYKGDELIEKTLELAENVKDRADLFFNLAMVCHHEQRRLELALHFFYLASKEDPADPGLRFSLEQAATDLLSQLSKSQNTDHEFLMMLAHLYQGSVGVAKRYAQGLKAWKFPESFEARMPERLWQNWLLKDTGVLGQALRSWFGGEQMPKKVRNLHR